MREPKFVRRHIVLTLRAKPDYAVKLPGGIHNLIAPANTLSPFLIMAFISGQDALYLNTNPEVAEAGTGILYLLKVQDEDNPDDTRAQDTADWVESALFAANGSAISGAYVYTQRVAPFSLPAVEQGSEVITQQEGATYRFWVDRLS